MKKEVETQYKEKFAKVELPESDAADYVNVCCPKCNQPAISSDININDKIAKCSSCNVVFSFAQDVTKLTSIVEPISRPRGIEIYEEHGFAEISMVQPYALLHILLATFLPLMILIFSLLYFKDGYNWSLYSLIGSSVLFLFSIFQLMNRKRDLIFITIERNKLLVQYRPKNLITDVTIPINHITQLYVKKSDTGSSLMVITDDLRGEKHQVLLSRLESIIQGKYLEQELERILGIPNKKVLGEEQ